MEAQFRAAAKHIGDSHLSIDNSARLRLYGLYKQAVEGDCVAEAPMRTNAVARGKWDAWSKMRGRSKEEAMAAYVQEVQSIDVNWAPPSVGGGSDAAADAASGGASMATGAAGPGSGAAGGAELGKEGTLYKQRDVLKGWRPRFFVLRGTMLSYYIDQADEQPRKSILLVGCQITPIKQTRVGDTEYYPFVVSHNDSSKTYNLASKSQAEQEDWVKILRQAAQLPLPVENLSAVTPSARLLERRVPRRRGDSNAQSAGGEAGGAAASGSAPQELVPREHRDKINRAVEIALQLEANMDEWQPMFNKQDVQAYRKPGALVTVRGDGVLNHHITSVFRAIISLDTRKEIDSQFAQGARLRVFNKHTWVDYLRYKQVWPTSARDFSNIVHWRVMDDGTVVVCAYSEKLLDLCPKEEGIVRADCVIGAWVLRPLSARSTKAVYMVQTDLKGTIPSAIVSMVAESQPLLIASLAKLLDRGEAPEPLFALSRKNVNNEDLEAVVDNLGGEHAGTGGAAGAGGAGGAGADGATADVKLSTTGVAGNAGGRGSTGPSDSGAASAGGGAGADGVESKTDDTLRTPLLDKLKQATGRERVVDDSLLSSRVPNVQGPRPVKAINLLVLFLPVLLYYLVAENFRGLVFVAGFVFAVRYILRLHLGEPIQRFSTSDTTQITEGRMMVKFPVSLNKVMRYLEEKRTATGMEITFSHLAIKAMAIALTEHPNLNGRVILGGFYLSNDVDISVSHQLGDGEVGVLKIPAAESKPVEQIAHELTYKARRLRSGEDKHFRAKKTIMQAFPPMVSQTIERAFSFLGSQLGVDLPALGVQAFPLGSCTLITAPTSEGGNDMDLDFTVIPTKYNASTPITLTIGGIRVQPTLDAQDKGRVSGMHVLNVTATVDCRAASLVQGRKLCERVQVLLRDPQLLDKHDRKKHLDADMAQAVKAPKMR